MCSSRFCWRSAPGKGPGATRVLCRDCSMWRHAALRSVWCARGEFAFDGREDAFDLGALAVRLFRKGSEHLIANGAIRNQMFRAFPKKPYRQRAKIESIFSAVKRKLSSRAPHRSERRVPPHRAIPAEHARRTRALAGRAAPTKSAAAHPLQSATSTKDDEAWARGRAAPSAGGRKC